MTRLRAAVALALFLACAAGRGQGPGAAEIDGWIADLGGANEQTAFAALKMLKTAGAAAVPKLRAAIRSSSTTLRFRAAGALAAIGRDAVPALVEALGEPDATVRFLAIEALRQIGSPAKDAIPTIASALEDASEEVRRAAARTLVALGLDSIPALERSARSAHEHARRLAAESLERIRRADPRAAGPPRRADAATDSSARWPAGAFVDVTAERAIDFTHVNGASGARFMVETVGAGAAWIDFDGDGTLDLYLVQGHRHPERALDDPAPAGEPSDVLYRGVGGGRFEDVTAKAGISERGYGMGAAAGDFDGDARPDIYVTNYGRNTLLRNRDGATFEDATVSAGVGAGGWSTAATWVDADLDGLLDLFVVRYVDYDVRIHAACSSPSADGSRRLATYCHPHHFDGVPDVLYHNLGSGVFKDVSEESGIAASRGRLAGKGLGGIASDFDQDGDPDLLVANDTTPNVLWRNLGGLRFEDAALETGFALNAEGAPRAGMGIDRGDVDGDLRLDFVVANFSREPDTLYLGQGPFFLDATTASGLAEATFLPLGFGLRLLDFDLDGDLDLYVANGHVLDNATEVEPGGEPGFGQPDLLLENVGSGRFRDASREAGAWFRRALVGRSVAEADFDGDGDPDLLVTNCGQAAVLLENRAGDGKAWVGFELRRKPDARGRVPSATGAMVEVMAGGSRWIHEAAVDGGYLSSSDGRVRQGLPGRGPVSARVRWPGRPAWQTFADLAAGQYHVLVER